MDSPYWGICDDGTRTLMVQDAWTYANQIGQHETTGKAMESWVANAQYNDNAVNAIFERATKTNRDNYLAGYGQKLAEAIDSDNDEAANTCLAALMEADATDAEIRKGLRDYYKPLYQQAFEDGDDDRMEDIKVRLIEMGVGFKASDFKGWVPGVLDEDEELNTKWLNSGNPETPEVTRSMPGMAEMPAPVLQTQSNISTAPEYLNYLMNLDEEGTLDQVSMEDFFSQVNSMTDGSPWAILTDAVGEYVDSVDPNLETSVAEMMDWLYDNGYTEDDIMQHKEPRAGGLPRSREKKVVSEGKGVRRGEAAMDPETIDSLQEGLNHMIQLGAGNYTDLSPEPPQDQEYDAEMAAGSGEPDDALSMQYSEIPASWLPKWDNKTKRYIWDDDVPEWVKQYTEERLKNGN
jgi:hypothetical protein